MKSTIFTTIGALMLLNVGFAQSVLWTDNFDNPSDWVIDNDGQTDPGFGWDIDATESSWFLNAFNSTSGGNFAELGNGDPTTGSQVSGVTYTLTLNAAIDIPMLPGNINGTDHVSLQYEQYGALFNDVQLTQISTDGSNWVTVRNNRDEHDVLSASGGSAYPNPELVKVNLAPYIQGDAASVSIRFVWTTAFPNQTTNPNVYITYGWGIDDLKIVTNPYHDMSVISSYVLGASNGGVHYGRTPIAQLDPQGYLIGIEASNGGVEDQTNATFSGDFGAFTANDSEATFTSLDTVNFEQNLSLPTTTGVYQGTFTLVSDDETASASTFGDNQLSQNLRISQNEYSVDGIGLHPFGQEQLATFALNGGDDLVVAFNLHQSMNVSTIRVLLDASTEVGAEIAGIIYEVDNGSLIYYDETISEFISSQDVANGFIDLTYGTVLPAQEYFIGIMNYSFNSVITAVIDRTIPQPASTTLTYSGNQGTRFFVDGAAAVRLIQDDCPNFLTNVTATDDACFNGLGGSVTVAATGATGPYNYTWNDGTTGATLSGVAAGTYVVTVTENSGCAPKEFEITIDPRPEMQFTVTTIASTCEQIADGGATAVVANGGVQPVSYAWSNGTQGPTISNVLSGTYTFDAVDDEGCLGEGTVIVPANTVDYNLDFSADVTVGLAPQTIVFTNSTPNIANYNFNWVYGDGDQEASNAATVNHVYTNVGTYTVELEATDIASGCVDRLSKTDYIDVPSGVGLSEFKTLNYGIHPNPGTGRFVLTQKNGQNNIVVRVLDVNGAELQVENYSSTQVDMDLTRLPQGVYLIQVSTENESAVLRYVKQ